MMGKKYAVSLESEFAAKCRKAIEEHYGGPVPTPRVIAKR